MLYNRYGYALLALVLLECFQWREGAEQDTGEMSGGISTVAIVLFLKTHPSATKGLVRFTEPHLAPLRMEINCLQL
jgi:hypothetical protein